MFCKKCGAEVAPNDEFCMNCGERMDNRLSDDGVKPRKDYKTGLFVVISIWLGGIAFGFSEFYAGFIKLGLFKMGASILGIIMAVSSAGDGTPGAMAFLGLGLIGMCVLIGVWELLQLMPRAYMLENGEIVKIRNLDKILDRKGVEKALMLEYGCSVRNWNT